MRKSLLKTAVSAVIVGAVVALSSVAVIAKDGDTFTVTANSFYTEATDGSTKKAPSTTCLTETNGATVSLTGGTNHCLPLSNNASSPITYAEGVTDRGYTSDTLSIKAGGGSRKLTITPVADGEITYYYVETSDSALASFSPNGTTKGEDSDLKIIKETTVECTANQTVTMTFGSGKTVFVEAVFTPISDSSASLTATKTEIAINDTLQLTGNVSRFTLDNENAIEYKSNNENVATVNNNGIVTGVSPGVATITYTAKGSGTKDGEPITEISAKIDITVTEPITATSLTLSKSELSLVVGKSETITASVEPNGVTSSVNWTSNDTTVATVEDGKITAVKAGTAVITASIDGLEQEVNVTVKDAAVIPSSGTGTASDLVEISANKTYDLLATAKNAGISASTNAFLAGTLYFDNEIFIPTALKYETSKTTSNLNNEDLSGGLKVKKSNGEVALKLASGYTVRTYIRSGTSSPRSGFISSTAGGEGDLAKSEASTNTNGKLLEFTNNDKEAKIIYISAENDCFIAQISVTADNSTVESTIADTLDVLASASGDYYAYDETNGNSYVIHGVTETEMAYGSLKLSVVSDNGTKKSPTGVETTNVYNGVKFSDGSEVTLAQLNEKFNKDYKAMFTLPLSDRIDTSHTYALQWINGNAAV